MEFGPGADGNSVPLLFTENSTNFQKLFDVKNTARFVKDAFHDYVVDGKKKCCLSIEIQEALTEGNSVTACSRDKFQQYVHRVHRRLQCYGMQQR